MPYNLLMPEDKQQSRPPRWLVLWQRRWWIALATLFILVWWLVPPWLYRNAEGEAGDRLKAITDTRTALLAGLIGVGALLTFWLNSRMYRITARTLEVTEQGHITERYTKAIEQLSQAELAMRLGGIYALERIAKDSERDHPTVVEVLSAFVREESRKQGATGVRRDIGQGAAKNDTTAPESESETAARPGTDIQAALAVLGRLPRRPEIARADFSEAQLSGARLDRANLSGAELYRANLSGARLDGANLFGARLRGANLSAAKLHGANLSAAKLDSADLSRAELTEANLTRAELTEANLTRAELTEANLSGARLYRANLSGAWLVEANLSDATLRLRDLPHGLTGDVLGLTQAQLDGARGNAGTQVPDGMRRPDHWTAGEEPSTADS
jgi:uncharacterized protein YjbI with pentapeptide repeats